MTADGAVAGVYGLRLDGLASTAVMSQVMATAPALTISVETGRTSRRHESFGEHQAEIALIDDGWVSLSRSGHAHFILPHVLPVEEIVHPWLVPAAATMCGWMGRHVLHGGVIARDDRAVAVVGEKEDGKSSLLAWLASTDNIEVLSDDLIVLEHGRVFAGPRCIDLRPGSADALAPRGGRLVRSNSRLRLELPPCAFDAALTGIVVLSWGRDSAIKLERLSAARGVGALLPHALASNDRRRLLDLVDVPVYRLVRPRTWASMPETARRLTQLLM